MARVAEVSDVGSEDDGYALVYTHAKGIFEPKPVKGIAQQFNAQTGTAYTLVAEDVGKVVTLDNADPVTVTLPADADAAFDIGVYVDLLQLGAGQVTVAAGSGATLRTSGATDDLRAQYSRVWVQKIAEDTWSLYGDLAAA